MLNTHSTNKKSRLGLLWIPFLLVLGILYPNIEFLHDVLFVVGIGTGADIQPSTYKPLPTGSITPKGWLLDQLVLQAEGLSGHLSQFWPDVRDSIWIGGTQDKGLHERTPYWLNGIVPLTYLLQNAGINELSGVRGLYKDPGAEPINLKVQMETYIGHLLNCVQPDGWLGPMDKKAKINMYWGPSMAIFTLIQYSEANQGTPRGERARQTVLYHLLAYRERMLSPSYPDLKDGTWQRARWMDTGLQILWCIDNLDLTPGQTWRLLDLATMIHDEGYDWENYLTKGIGIQNTTKRNQMSHNVNILQALKSSAVWYRFTGNIDLIKSSRRRMIVMDSRVGVPTGLINGDEHLPVPMTRHPSHGVELCGIVEAMFSYNVMFGIHGEPRYADRAERIAYNALPATWASPKGGDMWAHQYLHSVNEITAQYMWEDFIWRDDGDGPDSQTYGLEPNYGCCTANFNQGWPKFANNMIYDTSDGGVAVGIYGPVSAKAGGGDILVDIDTKYPFGDDVKVKVVSEVGKSLPVYLRVPGWAKSFHVNGKLKKVRNGTMVKLNHKGGTSIWIVSFGAEIYTQKWDKGAISVHRGPLLFALPLTPKFQIVKHNWGKKDQSNDYWVTTTDDWRYALTVSDKFTFHNNGKVQPAPFNHTKWPVWITAKGRLLKFWGIEKGAAAAPPPSPVICRNDLCGPIEEIILVPFGATDLRIGEFPTVS